MDLQAKDQRVTVRLRTKTAQKLEENARQYDMRLSSYLSKILEEKAWGETWENVPHISREIVSDTKMINSILWCFLKEHVGEEKARKLLADSKQLQADNVRVMIENMGQ